MSDSNICSCGYLGNYLYATVTYPINGKLNSWTIENQEEIIRANFTDPNLETSIYTAGEIENGIAGIQGNSLQDYVNNNKNSGNYANIC